MKDIAAFAEPQGFLERIRPFAMSTRSASTSAASPRGKRYPADKLKSLYGDGVQMPQSHFLLDVNGDNSDPVGRGFSDGDPDTTLFPVPGSAGARSLGRRAAGPGDRQRAAGRAARRLHRRSAPGPGRSRRRSGRARPHAGDGGGAGILSLRSRARCAKAARGAPACPTASGSRPPTPTASTSWKLSPPSSAMSRTSAAPGLPASVVTSEMAASQFEINLQHVDRRWPPPITPCCCAASCTRRQSATACGRASWPSPFSMPPAAACMSI